MSALSPNPAMTEKAKPKRLTEVSLELNSKKENKELTARESAKAIWGI